jgi:hypothetical protein
MIMKPSRTSSDIGHLTRPFTQSGWRDLNSRPLDPQIGPLGLWSVKDYRWCPLLTVGVHLVRRAWSVVSPHFLAHS